MLKTRKILIVAVLAAILSAIFAISAFAAETGTLYTDATNGDVTYTLDGTTLTIDFASATQVPTIRTKAVAYNAAYSDMLNNAKTVVIKGSKLTSMAGGAPFYGFRNMETLVIPSTITTFNSGTFSACANLKTVAPYTSESEIADIVANPTVGLIDLSNITTIGSTEHFKNAFAWGFTASNITATAAPAKLTIKFGNLTTGALADIFKDFSRTEFSSSPAPIEIAVLEGTAFATAAQTHFDGLAAGAKVGFVDESYFTVVPYTKEAKVITEDLYEGVTCSYLDTDPTTITITFPDGVTSLPKLSGKITDDAKKNMLNAAKTVIIKGKGLVSTAESSVFYGCFRNMETLVWPSSIVRLGYDKAFNNCHNLKTVAPYTSEDEIDAIVANPTVGLIDLSNITSIGSSEQFAGAFRWNFSATNSTVTTPPATLTFKFGELSVDEKSNYATKAAQIFANFSNADGYVATPVIIEVAYGDFATDVQTYVDGLTDGKLGNVTPSSVTVEVYGSDSGSDSVLDDSIVAKQIGVRYNGDVNGLRYEFKFDKNAQAYMEENGYELVEYGIIFASADNKANATLSKSGNEYVTSSDNITKKAIVKGNNWAEGAKIISDSETETVFAGTLVNWTEDHYAQEAYICAYSIYRDAEGVETISYISYGDEEGQSAAYATCSLAKLMNFMVVNNAFKNVTVSEASVWNTLLFGAETLGESKELAVDDNTVAILVDGTVVVRSLDGTTVADTAAATAAVEALGKTVTKTVSLPVEAREVVDPEGPGEEPGVDPEEPKDPELVTGTLYTDGENGAVTYSYMDNEPTTITLAFPAGTTSIGKLYGGAVTDDSLKNMLASAKTVIIEGVGLTDLGKMAFIDFAKMETLVMPNTIVTLSADQTFSGCKNLKTVAVYSSEDEISDVVANVTEGLVDLSYITSIGSTQQFVNAFQWTDTTAPETLTIKFGYDLNTFTGSAIYPTKASQMFLNFSTTNYSAPNIVIAAVEGSDFAKDATKYLQTQKNNRGLFGNRVALSLVSVVTREKDPELVTGTLYTDAENGAVTYSYWDNDPTTITITFPAGVTTVPRINGGTNTVNDSTLKDMLSATKTIVIKGSDLTTLGHQAFMSFGAMETLVIPSTITNIGWGHKQTFITCAELKTIAPYTSEDEIDAIVANPTVGLIDLSYITNMSDQGSSEMFFGACQYKTTTAPATLTFKFGNVNKAYNTYFACKTEQIFASFSAATFNGNVVIEVVKGSDFAADAQAYVDGNGKYGNIGNVAASKFTVVAYEKEAELITETLYTDAENGAVTYSYWDIDSTTITITFPAGITTIPRIIGGTSPVTVSDATLKTMLQTANTVIIKGSDLTTLGYQAFMSFNSMETLVIPSTITNIGWGHKQIFNSCYELKTIAPYTAESEIDGIVANPTVGLIDLSYITSMSTEGTSEMFIGACQYKTTTAPATLTFKFGNVNKAYNTYFACKTDQIFRGFSAATFSGNVVISVVEGSDFAADAQAFVDGGGKDGKIGNVDVSLFEVKVQG